MGDYNICTFRGIQFTHSKSPYEIARGRKHVSMLLYGEEMRPTERTKLEEAKQLLPRAQHAILKGARQNVTTAQTSKVQKHSSLCGIFFLRL